MSTTPAKPSQSQEVSVADLEISNPDGIKSVYCNNVQFSLTPWDLRMLCLEIGVGVDGSASQSIRANVVMSIPHAEALLVALGKTLEQVNNQRGKVAQPAAKK